MEKIAIGVPYEISIEPSIDIGNFDAELMLNKTDFQIGIKLKKIKGEDIDYSFIIPTKLKDTLRKAKVKYSIFVYKENARFEVDSGDIKFIDEKDFKVRVKDNAKMRPMEEEEEVKSDKSDKKESPKPEPKPSPSAEKVKESKSVDPLSFAEELINKQFETKSEDKPIVEESERMVPEPTPLPLTQPETTATKGEKNLHAILSEIEERKQKMARRDRVNQNIKDALHKK